MDKQKKILMGFLAFFMVCGMILTFLMINILTGNKPSEEIEDEPVKEEVHIPNVNQRDKEKVKEELSKNEDEETDVKKEEPQKIEDIFQIPEDNREVIGEGEAENAEMVARNHFRSAQFVKGVQSLSDKVEQYTAEGRGEVLHKLYEDGSYLIHFQYTDENVDGHAGSVESVKHVLEGIRDPEMALLGTLLLGVETRNQVIPSVDSINPAFEGIVNVLEKSVETEGRYFDEYSKMYDVNKLHRIDFVLETNHLYAYVVENSEGYSKLIEIREAEEGTTPYLTIQEWKDLMNSMKNKQ